MFGKWGITVKKTVPWVIMSFLILLCIISWSIYSTYKPVPSDLDMVVAKHTVEVKPATYSLRKWGRTASADTNTDPAVLVKDSHPIIVEKDDKIRLLFEQSPDSVKCYLWEMDTGKLAYKGLKGYPLNLEESNVATGDYAMEIRAKWGNGYVLYNTRIMVHDDTE
ncbi:hypothetical protein JCM21738_1057 [Mesobacillus boroniphilus JCM 21738]|uniref:Uncharacterized protein n=1 Tax=Mesobacillus boroniphilus JCM 21738 TaxID=1294265 RepID=W4RIU1_9BACI|nr:hypothetical protein JCM21738_1057 [Mesobacillus boroniphilus JCM 21738]